MELAFRPDRSVFWQKVLDAQFTVYIHARDIRRERGTLYAEIVIYVNKTRMDGDDFNLRKNEDKKRLVNGAHKKFSPEAQSLYPVDHLKHDLDIFCEELPRFWEEDQFTIENYAPGKAIPPISFVMVPYLLEDAITIVYGPQGTGKSYLAKLIGLSVCGASNGFWRVVAPRPVLYVNLERPRKSMERRARMLMKALSVEKETCMDYLHAPGAHLPTVAPRIRAWILAHPGAMLILDSLSFTGIGPLNDDTTGAKAISLLRSLGGTWLVLGHTPRGDDTHLLGSTIQDAGADLMVRLSSEKDKNRNGLALEVTKTNDTGIASRYYLAFEFSEMDAEGRSDLMKVRPAQAKEFPALLGDAQDRDWKEKVRAYLWEVEEATGTKIAAECHLHRPTVAAFLKNSSEFVPSKKDGKEQFYRLSETTKKEVPF